MAMALLSSIASGKLWRQAYALLAVSLASFVLLIAVAALANREAAGVDDPTATAAQIAEARATIAAAGEAYEMAHREAETAADDYELSHAEFLEFLQAHFSELAAASTPAREETSSKAVAAVAPEANREPDTAGAGESEPTAAAEVTPRSPRTELKEQLAILIAYRARLLGSLQPSHPSVGAVDFAIAEADGKLRALGPESDEPVEPQSNANVAATSQLENAGHDAAAEKTAAPSVDSGITEQIASADRWREDNERFQSLAQDLNRSRQTYSAALEREQRAWQQQVQALTDNPVALAQFSAVVAAARTRRTLEICGYLALGLGLCVSMWARRSERTFRTEAEVRQALDLQILGMLPRQGDTPPRESPRREPRWVARTVRASEIWLVAVVVLLAVMAVADSRFLSELIADPLAACSRKFWC